MARKQRKRKTPKDPIKRRRIAVFGGFSRWPGYLEPAGPAAEIARRGGTPVADPKAIADCDVVVFGDKRGKGKTEAGRQAEKAVAAGAKLEVIDEAAFLAWLAPDVTGKRFAFAGGFDFCHDGLAEAQPPALVEALGATVSVATVSAMAAITQSAMPSMSAPPPSRCPMISATPANPAIRPSTPSIGRRSRKMLQFAAATINGMVEAMIAASEASIHCIAMKFRPRYSAFWQMPKTATARHCAADSRQLCPSTNASATPTPPDSA